jgi:hypothetical protein
MAPKYRRFHFRYSHRAKTAQTEFLPPFARPFLLSPGLGRAYRRRPCKPCLTHQHTPLADSSPRVLCRPQYKVNGFSYQRPLESGCN